MCRSKTALGIYKYVFAMSDSIHQYRKFVGLAIVIVTYLGGIIGWSIAAVNVEAESEGTSASEMHDPIESRGHAPAMKLVVNSYESGATE